MRTNPFYDSWLFLVGETGSHLGVGVWRYLLVALYWSLLIASIIIAYRNWQADPAQRTQVHLGTWLARVAIGTMWFEGALWKLPIPSGGFQYWLEQEVQHAAFGFHQALVRDVLLPNFTAVNVVAFLSEMGMASAFILGFGVRAFAVLGMVFAAQLYFGLYTHPNEWPWEFIFIIVICWLFYIYAAGRSLGLDALLRRDTKLAEGDGLIARIYRWAS
jgi:uncharacterized membrane protein YphA (DoxX/SURF4 family)